MSDVKILQSQRFLVASCRNNLQLETRNLKLSRNPGFVGERPKSVGRIRLEIPLQLESKEIAAFKLVRSLGATDRRARH